MNMSRLPLNRRSRGNLPFHNKTIAIPEPSGLCKWELIPLPFPLQYNWTFITAISPNFLLTPQLEESLTLLVTNKITIITEETLLRESKKRLGVVSCGGPLNGTLPLLFVLKRFYTATRETARLIYRIKNLGSIFVIH